MKKTKRLLAIAGLCLCTSPQVLAANWSSTEVQFQAGELERVGTGGTADASIITLQHASGWKYGDNFFFMDHLDFDVKNNADFPVSDSSEIYGEWYSNFSLGKISGNDIKFGPIKDIGVLAGANFAPEVNSWWFLPGVRFSLDLPGFAFANLDIASYRHQGGGSASSTIFTVVDEDNSWWVDFNWAYPFKIGKTSWSLVGHMEYINGRTQVNSFGTTELESWVLAQPQLRLDVGEIVGIGADQLFIGIEYQFWNNKLGERDTDDRRAQFLAVWRF